MIWNNAEIYTSFFMVELQKGVAFKDSSLGLYGAFTSFESPFFANSEIRSFLESFSSVRNRLGMEIDTVEPVLSHTPGIFICANQEVSQEEALRVVNQHRDVAYVPVHEDFRVIGFFPSRPGSPVREISKEGVVYQNGKKYAKEFTSDPSDWAIELIADASAYCDARYSHYKVTESPFSEKAYIHATKLF